MKYFVKAIVKIVQALKYLTSDITARSDAKVKEDDSLIHRFAGFLLIMTFNKQCTREDRCLGSIQISADWISQKSKEK